MNSRLPFVDFLRAIASQIIVFHHLAFYGPLSDQAWKAMSGLIDGLYVYGRVAVQIFFVTAGYMAARSLARRPPLNLRDMGEKLWGRYRRIGFPYLAALVVALLANEVARLWMNHESISARPSVASVVAHVFFLQDILGYQALSAGIWYLAIDMQLFGILLILTWTIRTKLSDRGHVLMGGIVMGLGLLSAFWWNRLPSLEHYAPYFFASYSLGVAIAWVEQKAVSRTIFFGYTALILLAMIVDYRLRLLMALGIVAILMLALTQRWIYQWPGSKLIATMGRISYSLFLIHFPVSLVVNGIWSSLLPGNPGLAFLGMMVSYVLSLAAAYWFHHTVELPLVRLGAHRKPKDSIDGRLVQPTVQKRQAFGR
jgi:peptidoglycan/LPS O-acetylase OafA/YrhL